MKNPFKNLGIRAQLMAGVLASFLLSLTIIVCLTTLLSRVMRQTGNAFQTNADLDIFLNNIENTERAMETYMSYRTFESIDKYYHFEAAAESGAERLNDKPSVLEVKQKEYVIKMLSLSFFDLSNRAIAARRANNTYDADLYYYKALDCYSFLRDEISSLNMLFFNMNASNYTESKARAESVISRAVLCLIIIFVCFAILMYINIVGITRPLSEISNVALKIAGRDFDVPLFKSQEKNEIGNICRAFDSMIISIKEYIGAIWEKALKENELREKEIEMRALYTDARLKALQDQIHPHFLFNTLNTGAQLAMIEGADKTCYFLEQVADFLRYNIQHPGSDATIGEELGMLDNYLYIMKTRFGERYQFVKDIDESCLGVKIPNTILQPLVENCIKHGLKDATENGKVSIKVARAQSVITIEISDNGKGFAPEIKKEIMKQAAVGSEGVLISDKGHVSSGLINVISRLQIYFKDNNVFDIQDNPDGGTKFRIRIEDGNV